MFPLFLFLSSAGKDSSASNLSEMTIRTSMKLTKAHLEGMRLVGQVDNKYLLAVAGDTLVAIDQHAADERVRLESYPPFTPPGALEGIDRVLATVAVEEELFLSPQQVEHLDFRPLYFDNTHCSNHTLQEADIQFPYHFHHHPSLFIGSKGCGN